MQLVLVAVISLDGRLTRPDEPGPGFASAEDQAWFRAALREFDCSIMGRATFDTLPDRENASPAAGPLRVVMTRRPSDQANGASAPHTQFTDAKPAEIVADLRRRGRRRGALLGGGQVYRAFLDAGLVDAMWLTIEPLVLGGGTPLADGAVRDGRFELAGLRHLSANTLLLNFRRPGGPTIALPALA